jgi:hypothetical protein
MKAIALWSAALIAAAGSAAAAAEGLWRPEPQIDCTGQPIFQVFDRNGIEAGPAPDCTSETVASSEAPAPLAPPPKVGLFAEPVRARTLLFSGAVLLAVPLIGEVTWWRNEETEGLHTAREGWLGRDTYAGGADKVSHVVGSYLISRELALRYERFGNSPARSRALSIGMTNLAGFLIESGDGFTTYGFSWEDWVSNVLGSSLAAGIAAAGADDLVGLRFGYVRTRIPPKDGRAAAYGSDYSREIYSADLKLDGAFWRLGIRPGPARFLLLSLTYGSKGYRFSPVEKRERNVGIDVGLNAVEILKAVGVRENTWWGLPLLKFFTYYRLELTAWGWRYDLNHNRWLGFGTGGRFDPGKVIYR